MSVGVTCSLVNISDKMLLGLRDLLDSVASIISCFVGMIAIFATLC